MKHKKYIVFGWNYCAPKGGINDIKGSFETLDEAKEDIEEVKTHNFDFYRVVDRNTWEEVWKIKQTELYHIRRGGAFYT